MIHSVDNTHGIIDIFMKISGLDRENAYILHYNVWMFMHGIASMLATNNSTLTIEEIANLILSTMSANTDFIKKEIR